MSAYHANRTYDPAYDVRDYVELQDRSMSPPNGVLRCIVAARRGGKTWALRAIAKRRNDAQPASARYLRLCSAGASLEEAPAGTCLLIDEPGEALAHDPAGFLARCAELHGKGMHLVAALSPAEWARLREIDTHGRIHRRDLLFLPPVRPVEAAALASRTPAATALFAQLPPSWRRSLFLLELVFEMAEDPARSAGGDLHGLLRDVVERSEDTEFGYFDTVFHNGLTEGQRAILHDVARGAAPLHKDEVLERCGLLVTEGGRQGLGDPVLEAYLTPLRIHHLSDIHVGPKAAERVDVKEQGAHGERLGKAAGAGPLRESYANHLRELATHGQAPHLLVLSGDIAEYGSASQYDEAKEWLARLASSLADHPRLAPDEPRVLVAPGNHDVDWKQTSAAADPRARHRPFATAFDGFPRATRTHLEEHPDTRALSVARYPDFGAEILLLGSSELGGEVEDDPVRRELFELIDRLKQDAMSEPDLERAAKLRADVSRIDPGLVHHQDLRRVRETVWRQPVLIAVLHHPISPLPATEVVRFSGLLNAGEVKDTLFHVGCCLVLHGHVHAGWFGKEQWPERHHERSMRVAAAPSLGSREIQEPNGFNEIEILRERREGGTAYELTVRRMYREGTGWVEKAVMGPFTPGA